MITWAAIQLFSRKAWEWLKAVPTWVWAVIGWEIQTERLENLARKSADLLNVRSRVDEKVAAAQARHEVTTTELEEKEDELNKAAGDTDAITDAINESFREDKS